jgi:hypothetical protein
MAAKSLYLVLAAFFLVSCNPPAAKDHQKSLIAKATLGSDTAEIKWVEGEFEYLSSAGVYRTFWRKNEEQQYIGKGYFLAKGDTSFLIRMKLYREKGIVKMNYNVKEHDNGKDIEFTLSKAVDNLYVFENPFRDFPSILQYKFQGDSAINIIERGFDKDRERVKDFTLVRIR